MAAQTVTEILDALNDYSDYEEVGSAARARSFITAARRFLTLPSSQSSEGASMGYNQASVQEMIQHARAYVESAASAASTGGVRHLGIGSDFRR